MSEKTVYVIELNDKLSPGLKKAAASALGLDNAMGKASNGGVGGLKSSIMGLLPALAAAGVAMKAFQFASESVRSAREFESLTNAITFASGSMEEGARNMDFLRSRSNLLGLDLLSASEGFKTISAAAMGSALEGQATRDIFDGVSVAVSAMGLDAETAKGTFLSLGQMISKGTVMSEELKHQLGDRLPGAFQAAARAQGVTTKQFTKMLEQGQIISSDFLPKFANELKKTFGGALTKSTKSAAAEFNRFNTTMLELKVALGNSLIPMLNRLMGKFKEFYAFIKTRSQLLKESIIEPFKNLMNELQPALSKIKSAIFKTFGVDSWVGLFDKGISLVSDFILALKSVAVPIFTLIANVSSAFSSLFDDTSKSSEDLFRGQMIADLAYWATFASETISGVAEIMSGGLSASHSQIARGSRQIMDARMNARFAERQSLEEFKAEKKKQKLDRMFANGKSVNDERLAKTLGVFDSLSQLLNPTSVGKGNTIGPDGKPTKTATSTVDEIKSGRPMNIYIDINKMIESFNVTATNLDDMNNKAKDLVAQALLSAVNNVNLIAR